MTERGHFVPTEDLPGHGLHAGDLGTVVMVHTPGGDYTGPAGYTAEFTWNHEAVSPGGPVMRYAISLCCLIAFVLSGAATFRRLAQTSRLIS